MNKNASFRKTTVFLRRILRLVLAGLRGKNDYAVCQFLTSACLDEHPKIGQTYDQCVERYMVFMEYFDSVNHIFTYHHYIRNSKLL